MIVGAGRVGLNVGTLLMKHGHEIALIEKDKEKCEEASRKIDALVVNDDGTQPSVLEEVGVKNADVFVAATGKDEVNLFASLVARDMGAKSIIARVSNPEHREIFKKLAIGHVISPELTAATYIEKLVMRPGVADLALLGREDVEILEFQVRDESSLNGKEVGGVKADGFLFIAIYKNGDLVIPTGKTIFEDGDRVLVLVKTEMASEVEKLFQGPMAKAR